MLLNLRLLFLNIILAFNFCIYPANATMEEFIKDWLDPSLTREIGTVQAIIEETRNDFAEDVVKVMPNDGSGKEFGREHEPSNGLHHQILTFIHLLKKELKDPIKRLAVADLGGGTGRMTALAVFAGALVDYVERPERAKLSQEYIYKTTRRVLRYYPKEARNFYRIHAASLLTVQPPKWTETPHDFIYCIDVVHYFTDTQIKFFAQRVYDNLKPGGVLAVATNAPFWCQDILDYYKNRQGTHECPGMGIYSIKKKSRLEFEAEIIPYDKKKYNIRPGDLRQGVFKEDGTIKPKKGWQHYFFSLYMLEDLAAIFEDTGFKVIRKYYLGDGGIRIEDERKIAVGSIVETCVFLEKN